jgi:ubiquinone biosynthesis monooxygenase Coq7
MTAKKKAKTAAKKKRTLPGDKGTTPRDHDIASIIRVNHAGEYGARQIYAGQLAVLGKKDPKIKKLLEHMAEQELKHLEYFENQIVARQTRPSALQPFWHMAGYAVGYLTAKMGTEAAMACTVAVEHVIADHYGEQLEALKDNKEERALYNAIKQFKAEEEEHHDIGIEENAEQAPAYKLLSFLIGRGSKLAIEIAKRV